MLISYLFVVIFDNGFKASIFKVVFAIALFALCINITINRFRIKDYFALQTQYSNLYEKHYKPFSMTNLNSFAPKQNLVMILVESLESNLSHNNGGGELS